MSLLNDNKKSPIEVDVTVDAEAASFSSGDIEFSKEDIEESKKMFYRETQLTQGLNSRLIGMIALVGIFGTGLFLSSGGTLATAGPVGMLLSYIFVGLILIANQVSALEVSTLCPVTSGNILQSSYFLDKAVAFALGYVNLYSSIIPGELAAASVVVSYWTDINPAVFISIFIVVIIAVNSYNVRWYGEVEFGFGILKLSLVLGLILVGLVIDLGGAPNHERLGFRYWKDPGPFAERYATGSLGKFLAFWKCVSSTVYSFGGAQSSAFFAGETQYPRRAINRAMKRIMVRVLFFYWVAVFILSLIVPYNDEKIASPNGTASGSAWVIAVERSGIKVLPHIINAIVMTSALSAANLGLIGSSRTLYSLASNGQAPKIFLKVNKHGLPWVGVVLAAACLPLAYLSVSEVTGTVFSWFQSITAANLLLNWMIYAANHISMNRALKAQGLSRNDLPYSVRGGQYAGPVSFFFCFIIFFTSGFAVFLNGNWAFANFFSSYFIIPLFIGLFIFGKLWFKTSIIKPEDVPIKAMLYDVQARPEPPYEKLRGWKIITVLWS